MTPAAQSSPPRIALIGVSGYGIIYLQLLRAALRSGSVRLVAAVIINPRETAGIVAELQAGGTVIYGSADELFAREAGKIDLCMIPTGIPWHARLTVAALRAGMNVLVEKPLAGSVADCTAIRQAETATGHWVAVGFQDIYSDEARRLKARLLAGIIGNLQTVRMIGLWPRPRAYFARNHWAGRIRADGAAVLDSPLNNAFAHFVNLGLFFAGPSAGESGTVRIESAELLRAHAIEMFDTAVVRGETASGARFWCGFSHTIETTRQPEIHLVGDAGRIEWHHEAGCMITTADGREEVLALPDAFACRDAMFASVLARLRDPRAFICTTALAERHSLFVENVQNAATVHTLPTSAINWLPDASNQSEVPCVRGLAVALGQAFEQGASLASVFAPADSASPFAETTPHALTSP